MNNAEWLKLGVAGLVPVHFTAETLSKATDTGELEGWATVYNVADEQDDVLVPGAFTKTLADWRRGPRVIALTDAHDNSPSGVLGSVSKAADSAYGLKLTFKYSGTPKAQDIRTKAVEGHIMGLSVFGPIIRHAFESRDGRDLRVIQEAGLWAVGMTPMPFNEKALITVAISVDGKAWWPPDADEGGLSKAWVCHMKSALDIGNAAARRAAVDLLVKAQYNLVADPSTGGTGGTGQPAGDDTVTDDPADDASAYALSLIGESGPSDSSPGGGPSLSLADQLLATLEGANTSAELDTFAAEIGTR